MQTYRWKPTLLPELPVDTRVSCVDEVICGLSDEAARVEALRCLQCPTPSCQDGCPNENPIRDILASIADGRMNDAVQLVWTTNALPSCTGRVCPWESQCEGSCILNAREAPIRIGAVERYLGDYAARERDSVDLGVPAEELPGEVAVVGAGPAGLAAAHFLRRLGHPVTVYDGEQRAGGVMDYGIPEFVLPKKTIRDEVDRLRAMGVAFRLGTRIGREITFESLVADHDAVFLAVGANHARTLTIPGGDQRGVVTAQEFLKAFASFARGTPGKEGGTEVENVCNGKRVVVVGAGNTAMDAARAAVRMGAADVLVAYRRSQAESPSRPVEVEHAEREGVRFQYCVNPTRITGSSGHATGIELVRMELSAPDESGRPRPIPVEGSEHVIAADIIVLAIGYEVEDDLASDPNTPTRHKDGRIQVDWERLATSMPGVFSGGDCVTGPMTVSSATAAGRRAAYAIHEYLQESLGSLQEIHGGNVVQATKA